MPTSFTEALTLAVPLKAASAAVIDADVLPLPVMVADPVPVPEAMVPVLLLPLSVALRVSTLLEKLFEKVSLTSPPVLAATVPVFVIENVSVKFSVIVSVTAVSVPSAVLNGANVIVVEIGFN